MTNLTCLQLIEVPIGYHGYPDITNDLTQQGDRDDAWEITTVLGIQTLKRFKEVINFLKEKK